MIRMHSTQRTGITGALLTSALLAGALLADVTAAAAQATAAPPAPANTVNVEVEPIECYWRAGTTAVHVGERFTVVLTCGVIDTAATTVVPDRSRLDPGVVQFQPFEVLEGRQSPDIRTASRRFFQYEYTLRYIGEDIGRDLAVPPLSLSYRVQNRVKADAAAVESRERQYILPARPVRVISLLPPAASDIRDVPPPTFADVEQHMFRASVYRIVSVAVYGLGAMVGIWALAGVLRRRRTTVAAVVRHATDAAILRGVSQELADVTRQRDGAGWSDALAARALSAVRIAATIDAMAAVSQTPAASTAALVPGQMRIRARWPRGGGVIISGAATPETLALERGRAEAEGSGRASRLGALGESMAQFASAAYGRADSLDASALDDALATGSRVVTAVRREHTWIALALRALGRSAADLRARAWAR